MKYIILSANSTEKLAEKVQELLATAWSLQGGVSIAVDQGRYEYVQAMIKESY